MNAKIVLGKITSAAQHLTGLHQIYRRLLSPARSKQAGCSSFHQCEADPVIRGPPCGRRIVGLPSRFSMTMSIRPSLNRSPIATPRLTRGV